jgi:hemerythrin superfamily protein
MAGRPLIKWNSRWNISRVQALVGGVALGGAALVQLVPMLKKRAARVTTILKKDHRMVRGLLWTLERAGNSGAAVRRPLFRQLRTQLVLHAEAEEEIVYPVVRALNGFNSGVDVDEAYREHDEMKVLLDQLESLDPNSSHYEQQIQELTRKVEHHIDEEESMVFPLLKQNISVEEQERLGYRIREKKAKLRENTAA